MVKGLTLATTNSNNATAFNSAYHIAHCRQLPGVWTWITYHSYNQDLRRYEGHLLSLIFGYWPPDNQLLESNDNAAFPAIAAYAPDAFRDEGPVVVAYLSGAIDSFLNPSNLNPQGDHTPYKYIHFGNLLKVAVQNWGVLYHFTVPLGPGGPVGVPSVVYYYKETPAPGETKDHFLIAFMRYPPGPGDTTDVDILKVGDVIVRIVGENTEISYTPIHSMAIGPDAYNPSIAQWNNGNTEVSGGPPESTYIHVVYEDPGTIFYHVIRIVDGVIVLVGNNRFPLSITSDDYRPNIACYGDRIFLTWIRRRPIHPDLWEPGDIMRRHKHRADFESPREFWDPEFFPVYDDPENICIWDDHPASPANSEHSQSCATGVVWMEGDTAYLRDYDPDHPGEGNFATFIADDQSQFTLPDLFPHIYAHVDFDSTQNRIATRYFLTWTEATGSNPPYRIALNWMSTTWPPQPVSPFATFGPKPTTPIKIIPPVPIYYEIVCGDSVKSSYCVKRDGYSTDKGHKTDVGLNELIYNLHILFPPSYYVIRAITYAPESTLQTFSFNDNNFSASLSAAKAETLFYVLTPTICKNGNVELRITGTNGAYLENLRVYQVGVFKDTLPFKPQGIIASNPSTNPLNLTVAPNLFRNSATIYYSIPHDSRAKLTICDASGRIVEKLIDKELKAGNYTLTWDRKGLPAGVYFARLKTQGYTATDKLLIMR